MSTIRCNLTQCKYNKSQFCEKLTVFIGGGMCSETLPGAAAKEYTKQIPQPDIEELYEDVEEDESKEKID